MLSIAIFTFASGVAALMLIVAIRALTWHKVSGFLTSILLLLVLFATWQVLARSGSTSLERGVLFTLCGLVGLLAGLIRGQNTSMRFEPSEGDVLCRRGALLALGWAITVVISVTLWTIPGLRPPAWAAALAPALIFLTSAFTVSTLIIIARASALRREHFAQLEQEQAAQEHLTS